MDVTIRKAAPEDAQGVANVLNEVISEGGLTAFDRPFSRREEQEFIAGLGPRSALFVAEFDGDIIGVQSIDEWASYSQSMRHVATLGTWIRSQSRGLGIGRRLTSRSFDFARRHGYGKVVIQVLADNSGALGFYRRLGFREIGLARRHVRLADHLHDALYLEMPL